jgi:hypothetical protein
VPVGDDQAVLALFHLVKSFFTIRRLVDVGEAGLPGEVMENPDDGLLVINDKDRHRIVDRHCLRPPTPQPADIRPTWDEPKRST